MISILRVLIVLAVVLPVIALSGAPALSPGSLKREMAGVPTVFWLARRKSSAAARQPPVYGYQRSCDVSAAARAEQYHDAGDVFRPAQSFHRDVR